jgi:hypothetical protein
VAWAEWRIGGDPEPALELFGAALDDTWLVQGAGAAVMLPASMALIREANPDPGRLGAAGGPDGGQRDGAYAPVQGGNNPAQQAGSSGEHPDARGLSLGVVLNGELRQVYAPPTGELVQLGAAGEAVGEQLRARVRRAAVRSSATATETS